MSKKKYLFSLGYFLLFIGGIFGQETIATTGGEATGDGGSVSYTVGQIFYEYSSSNDYSVLQGVQQPYEISSTDKDDTITLEYLVYPNPTTDFIVLNILNYNQEYLTYKLYNTRGKLLISMKIRNGNTKVMMKYFMSATYFLVVSDHLKILKTFKIIKN